MKKSDTINKLTASLVKAQALIQPAIKDSSNPFFNSTYANLESCWDAIRKPLTDNGLAVMQLPCQLEGKPALETILFHECGEWISETIQLYPVKTDPQSMGSAQTYQRRYSLAAIIGLVQTDDDGNAANGRDVSENKRPVPTPGGPKLIPPMKRDPAKMATENQLKFIWAKLKGELNLEDDEAKLFLQEATGKQSSKEFTAGDIEKVLAHIEKSKREISDADDSFNAQDIPQ